MLHAWPPRSGDSLYVFLHGFTGAPSAWDEVVADLPATCWGVHLPGHHPQSPAPNPTTPFDSVADAIAAQIAPQLQGRRAHLVGYSLGARLALSLMLRHPSHWHHATLMGCHPGLRDPEARQARSESDARWEHMLRTAPLQTFNQAWAAQPIFASQHTAPAHRLAAQDAVRAAQDPHALADMLRATSLATMPARWAALGASSVPCTWVAGASDAKFAALARQAAAATPAARCVLWEGVGHNPLLEAPTQVAALLRAQPA